ncbi:MAG: hypothetical protein ACYTBJ_01215 [Planctomycetota bacterium]|jgi:hypothetical protein
MSKTVVIYLSKDPVPAKEREFYRIAARIAKLKHASHLIPAANGKQIVQGLRDVPDNSIEHLIMICHGGTQWLLTGRDGIYIDSPRSYSGLSLSVFAQVLIPKLTPAPFISLGACLCGRSPHWYLTRRWGKVLSPWGAVSYKDGGKYSFAGILRNALALQGLHPTIRSHTAAGHCTALPLLREHDDKVMTDGRSLFSKILGSDVSPSLHARRWWVRAVRGHLAERLLLFDYSADLEIWEKWRL